MASLNDDAICSCTDCQDRRVMKCIWRVGRAEEEERWEKGDGKREKGEGA